MSVDPAMNLEASISSPQRWNRYAYVSNNPLRKVDPDGKDELDLAIGWVQGIGQALAVAVKGIVDLVDSRGLPSYQTLQDAAATVEFGKALGYGATHLGEVADQYVQMSTSPNDADQRTLGQAIGQGTFVAAATLAPLAKAPATSLREGTTLYRVWGDGSGPNGKSWTTVDPSTVPNYRDAAGLPAQNTGRFVSEGILKDATGVTTKSAVPLAGNRGGLPEVVVPKPQTQIELCRVSGCNPSY